MNVFRELAFFVYLCVIYITSNNAKRNEYEKDDDKSAGCSRCSSDDPLGSSGSTVINGNDNSGSGSSSGSISGNGGSSTGTYSEMTTFTIAIDKTTAEPTDVATAQYPEEGDAPSSNTFATKVNIDMTNPADPQVDGVAVTVDGNNVTVNHGNTEGICYVVTGTTTDGSLIINGKTN